MESWIESFKVYVEDKECAPVWCQWAAISAVASVLERKVWATTTKGDLYPNMYTILVGAAGSGKSIAIMNARKFLESLDGATSSDIHLAPTSLTMASLADELSEAKRVILRPGATPPAVEYNALSIVISEFGAFMHEYDRELMAGLTDIWDGWPYSQRRRGGNLKIKIAHPQLNILAGSTPSNLIDFMPERAWDQGFASRMIMVFSAEKPFSDIFADLDIDPKKRKLHDDLTFDLRLIGDIYGKMVFDPAAIEAFRQWRNDGEKPLPDHPKLTDYCARRTAHLIKLCMVACASRASTKLITVEDFDLARNWLLGAELTMADVFRSGSGGGDSKAMDETWHYVWKMAAKTKTGVPEHELVHFVRERVPSHSIMRVIEIMERDGSIKGSFAMSGGPKTYVPGPRKMEF